jgi:hypothetical protein
MGGGGGRREGGRVLLSPRGSQSRKKGPREDREMAQRELREPRKRLKNSFMFNFFWFRENKRIT